YFHVTGVQTCALPIFPTIRFMSGPSAAPEGDDGSHSMLPARTSTAQARSVAKAGASPIATSSPRNGTVGSSAHAAASSSRHAPAARRTVAHRVVIDFIATLRFAGQEA